MIFTNSEAGWGTEAIIQPAGRNKLPLTITRSTTDGKFKLAQKFTWNPTDREITIEMTLTNTSGQTQVQLWLGRYFRPHTDNVVGNYFARTRNAFLIFKNGLSNALVITVSGGLGGAQLNRQLSIYPAETFNPAGGSRIGFENAGAGTWFGDGVGLVSVQVAPPVLAPGASRTIKVKYEQR